MKHKNLGYMPQGQKPNFVKDLKSYMQKRRAKNIVEQRSKMNPMGYTSTEHNKPQSAPTGGVYPTDNTEFHASKRPHPTQTRMNPVGTPATNYSGKKA